MDQLVSASIMFGKKTILRRLSWVCSKELLESNLEQFCKN